MKNKEVIFLIICTFLGLFVLLIARTASAFGQDSRKIKFKKLSEEQQTNLTENLEAVFGENCIISTVERIRYGGQAQVTYFYITLKCDSIHTDLPLESERSGSGYYYDGEEIIVRILGEKYKYKENKKILELLECLELIFSG